MNFENDCIYYAICNLDDIDKYNNRKSLYLVEKMLDVFDIKMGQVCYTEYGKPYFENLDLYFNCSHSNNYIVAAISSVPLGVDIEEDRVFTDLFSDIYLDSTRGCDKLKTFIMKEAYSKLDGRGIRIIKDIKLNNIKSNYKYIGDDNYNCCIVYDGDFKNFVDLSSFIKR